MPSCASWRAARVEHDQPGAPASRSACTSLTSVSQSTSCSVPARYGLRPRLSAAAPDHHAQDDDRVDASMAWALEHLAEPIPLTRLAARALMSPGSYARHVGFETAVTYRSHFARTFRTSPSAYRRAFRAGAPRPAA
jgi:transcriptional regulator GlxA family with amidase domain